MVAHEDKAKNFWWNFRRQDEFIYEAEQRFIHYKNNPLDKYSLSHNRVMEFLEDDKGLLVLLAEG